MLWGSMPVEDRKFLFTDEELEDFLQKEPKAKKYIRRLLSRHEFLNGKNRWCLWLQNADPSDLKSMPQVLERINNVKNFRLSSSKEPTRKAALCPTLFAELRQPKNDFIFFPLTSSENRTYIPIGLFSKEDVPNNSASIIQNTGLYHFGILTSLMHMAWTKNVCGRLKSDFRYSGTIVYNNYPWPENPNEKQVQAVEAAAQNVLDARAQFPNASLADLYDPNAMPPVLVKAHQALDKPWIYVIVHRRL